jgi:AcrR family transcriptional regulator
MRTNRETMILDAAKAVFAAVGYPDASMDAIAAEAGTTKRTVYNYFPTKEALFRATVGRSAERFLEFLPPPDPKALPARAVEDFLARLVELSTFDEAVRLQRVVIAERARFPGLAREFAGLALGPAIALLADYLRTLSAAKRLHVSDPDAEARRLVDHGTAGTRLAVLFDLSPPIPDAPGPEISARVDRAPIKVAIATLLPFLGPS